MGRKSVEKCLEEIFADIELKKHVDYGSNASVRQCNRANDRIRLNLLYIDEHYPERIDVIHALLEHPDPRVVTHCAVAMQDMHCCTVMQKKQAIDAVRKLSDDGKLNTPEGLFLQFFWIKTAEQKLSSQEQ